jgi:hypothetical protein
MRSRTLAGKSIYRSLALTASAIVTAVSLALGGIAGVPAANADPSRKAGSTSKSATAKWTSGWTYYKLDYGAAWSWSAGTSKTSKISKVRGHSYATPYLNNQVQNASGPTDINRNAILSSSTFGSTKMVYYQFQSRSCVVNFGKGLICSAWKWHRQDRQLEWGGNWYLKAGY